MLVESEENYSDKRASGNRVTRNRVTRGLGVLLFSYLEGEQGFLLLVSWSSSPIESRKVYTATPRLLPKSRLNREFLSPISKLEFNFGLYGPL